MLITKHSLRAPVELNDQFQDEIADRKARLIDLVNGKETDTCLGDVIAKRAEEETPQSPALLLLDD